MGMQGPALPWFTPRYKRCTRGRQAPRSRQCNFELLKQRHAKETSAEIMAVFSQTSPQYPTIIICRPRRRASSIDRSRP